MGELFYMGGLMIRSCHGESFTDACSSNLNSVNLIIFPTVDKALRLLVRRFQKSGHVQFP